MCLHLIFGALIAWYSVSSNSDPNRAVEECEDSEGYAECECEHESRVDLSAELSLPDLPAVVQRLVAILEWRGPRLEEQRTGDDHRK